MLLSLRDELRVVLGGDQVLLVRLGRQLTLHGISYRILDKKAYSCDPDSTAHSGDVLGTLEKAISELPEKPAVARVVISNHYMRYAIIPWSENLSNESEEVAYAKHWFGQLYGASTGSWDVRLNQDFVGAPQLASAVDQQLIDSLRELFVRAQVKLKSVQPQLMAAYNNCQAHFQHHDVWFVLHDTGSLCLGLVRQGHWSSVRTLKVGDDWLARLPELLDREVYLNESDSIPDTIFLWAPEYWKSVLPRSGDWKINQLQPVIRPEFAAEYDERYALAMCG